MSKNANIEKLYRFGLFSKGIVYVLIGVLFISASGARNTGSKDALQYLGSQPYGQILLGLIGVGLFGYVAWRLYQVFGKSIHGGKDEKVSIAKRIGYLASAIVYGFLGYSAFSMINGGGGGSGSGTGDIISKILSQSWGDIFLIASAIIFFIVGIYQFYKAVSNKFMKNVSISGKKREVYKKSGKIGIIARSVVFFLLGWQFLSTGPQGSNPASVGQALEFMQNKGGIWMAIILAAGLTAYGVYTVIKARYRHIT